MTSLPVQVAVVLVTVCLCHISRAQDNQHNIEKKGFRVGSPSRVAHGYGKRGYSEVHISRDQMEASPGILEALNDGNILSVDELTELATKNPNLARALIKKFVDLNDDDFISTEEIFKPELED